MSVLSSQLKVIYPKFQSLFPKLLCGVSTRIGGVSRSPFDLNLSFNVGDDPICVTANRERFFGEMGISINRVAITKQVHGSNILSVENPGNFDSCDALISNSEDLFLAITVADCLPILLFDKSTNTFAAVHAGWKGSKSRILEKTIKGMIDKYEVASKNIHAFVGPSAGVCCYEVGQDVASQFDEQYLVRSEDDKQHLNLKQFNKELMIMNGISERNIEVAEYCTICNPTLFHSYRREGNNSGRMMAVIGISK